LEQWTFKRYHSPQLDIDSVATDGDEGAILIKKDVHCYRLETENVEAAQFVAGEIAALVSADSDQWRLLRESESESGWDMIAQFFDQRSLIRETDDHATSLLSELSYRLTQIVLQTYNTVRQNMVDCDRRLLDESVQIAKKAIDPGREFGSRQSEFKFFDPAHEPNFFRALLQCELEYFRRKSPLTLAAAHYLVLLMAEDASPDTQAFEWKEEDLVIYDHSDLEAHLWLVAQCLLESAGPNANRFPLGFTWPSERCSGIEFMRQIELATRATGMQWGENPYVTALDKLDNTYAPLVAGPFIEQYHVTRRFVEILAPTLSKRLIPPLRKMIFQYYAEEVGHEELESTTCEILGVTENDLNILIPLPGHFAFVDVLTLVAVLDPIASLASIMVIEGVYGEPPKMSLRLAAIARDNPAFAAITDEHEEMNEDLNHNSISRNAFEHIESVSVETQVRVMHRIMFLLELNHRAWGWMVDFYGPQQKLMLHGPQGVKFSPQQLPDEKSVSHKQAWRTDIRRTIVTSPPPSAAP
jgi:hypothetical protein